MRIGVLGNCQVGGLAASLAALAPRASILAVRLDAMRQHGGTAAENLDRLAGDLAACDVVFAQPVPPRFGPLSGEAFAARARPVALPRMGFAGFHPDCCYVRDGTGALLRGGLDVYNSALLVGCFLEGIPPARARRLFNAYAYASLGYFDVMAEELARLSAAWAALGFDLAAARAEAPAVFMLTTNHPRIGLLHGLARQALARAGLAASDAPPPEDELARSIVWPVYPEIAERLGVEGGLGFQLSWRRRLDPEEMVRASFAAYAAAAAAPGIASSPQIERVRAFLRAEVLQVVDPRPAATPRPGPGRRQRRVKAPGTP
ncbi:WcbI family polysaccharide biosynthesis putative acetyltransferase [Falsiroseomonas sp. HW251]|uniref:WcbI family polysaccharide biosynthesis putative acetyltransferase n=1 Tax=Falsiroseomonas sp. HW251 TaxID=3390998 RepID=UPI003D311D45